MPKFGITYHEVKHLIVEAKNENEAYENFCNGDVDYEDAESVGCDNVEVNEIEEEDV